MLTQLLSGDRVVVRGSVNRERDLIYVDDAATAIIASVFVPDACNQIINLGTGIPVTIYKIIEVLTKALNRNIDAINIVEEAGTVGDPFSNVADCSKARNILGFVPRYDLMSGVQELMEAGNYRNTGRQ